MVGSGIRLAPGCALGTGNARHAAKRRKDLLGGTRNDVLVDRAALDRTRQIVGVLVGNDAAVIDDDDA